MKILGIDTTTKYLCLGAYDSGKVYGYNIDLGRRHAELITIIIKRVLEALKWRFKDIDYFACGLGPGSFTGIRVGLATVKGLAIAVNKPVIGIPTLDILAKSAPEKELNIIPIIDARRNLVYTSIYRNRKGALKRISPYRLLAIKDFLKIAKKPAVIFGDALDLYKQEILCQIKGVKTLDKDYWFPKGHCLIELALEKIKQKKISSVFKIKPIYLYPKECQIRNKS